MCNIKPLVSIVSDLLSGLPFPGLTVSPSHSTLWTPLGHFWVDIGVPCVWCMKLKSAYCSHWSLQVIQRALWALLRPLASASQFLSIRIHVLTIFHSVQNILYNLQHLLCMSDDTSQILCPDLCTSSGALTTGLATCICSPMLVKHALGSVIRHPGSRNLELDVSHWLYLWHPPKPCALPITALVAFFGSVPRRSSCALQKPPICSYLILDRALGCPHNTLHVYCSHETRKLHKVASSRRFLILHSHQPQSFTVFW